MESLESQLESIFGKWFSDENMRSGEEALLDEISSESKENTKQGKPYAEAQRYDNTYERNYARRTGKSQSGPVTLRDRMNRFNDQYVRNEGDHSELYFRSNKMGEIGYYQQERGNHGKIRKFWPEKVAQISQQALDKTKEYFIRKINGDSR